MASEELVDYRVILSRGAQILRNIHRGESDGIGRHEPESETPAGSPRGKTVVFAVKVTEDADANLRLAKHRFHFRIRLPLQTRRVVGHGETR